MGVIYIFEDDNIWLTTTYWPLTCGRLKGDCVLSKIILLCYENVVLDLGYDNLERIKKYSYRYNILRKLFLKAQVEDYTGGNLKGQFNEVLQGEVLLDVLLGGNFEISF